MILAIVHHHGFWHQFLLGMAGAFIAIGVIGALSR